jgi:hypothetical protein
MLENPGYASPIRRDPSLAIVRLDRHRDEAGMKASKKAFQHVAVTASVVAANRHAGKRFEDLYQRTIDQGGHPNERSVTSTRTPARECRPSCFTGTASHSTWRGIVSLELLQVLYNAEFELLGINAAMLDLRKDLLDRCSVRPVLSTWMPREQAPRAGRVR